MPVELSSEPAGTPASARPSVARQRILDTADALFYNEGIHAVGIHRIVDEANVTRVTLYRHFPSKDDLIAAYLEGRAAYDRNQISGLITARPTDPRRVLTELATALTQDDFAAVRRGCPFINSSAEFTGDHAVRRYAADIRRWVTERIEELLVAVGHRSPGPTAAQLMMIRTGAVVSGALDDNPRLNQDFLDAWTKLIDDGLPVRTKAGRGTPRLASSSRGANSVG